MLENLEFQVIQTEGKIECNFDELQKALALQMSAYADVVVDEDSIPQYKGELATLRKIRTAVDNKRKDIKREFLVPLDEFEDNVKKLLEEIDKPIDLINSQLALFEEDRKLKKKERIKKMYETQVGEFIKFLSFEVNFNEKWLNKSTSDNDIAFDISEKLQKVKSDLAVIDGLNSEIKDELIETYRSSNNDLSKAVNRNSQYLSDKAKIEEAKKIAETKIESKETESQNKVETSETKVETNPLEGSMLNEVVQMTKTAKIIISLDDLEEVTQTLDFMEIKYQLVKD